MSRASIFFCSNFLYQFIFFIAFHSIYCWVVTFDSNVTLDMCQKPLDKFFSSNWNFWWARWRWEFISKYDINRTSDAFLAWRFRVGSDPLASPNANSSGYGNNPIYHVSSFPMVSWMPSTKPFIWTFSNSHLVCFIHIEKYKYRYKSL